MPNKIYPKEQTKQVLVKKEGYNSISQVKETEEGWEYELYNPNVEPVEPKKEEKTDTE